MFDGPTAGIGYRNQFRRFDTFVAIPTTGGFLQDLETYRQGPGQVFDVKGATCHVDVVRQLVADRQVEVASIVDDEAARRLEAGDQAQTLVVYNEVDPHRTGWLEHFAKAETSEMNRRIDALALPQRQPPIQRARAAAKRAEQRLSNPEVVSARQDPGQLSQDLTALEQRGPTTALNPLAITLEGLARLEPNLMAFRAPDILAPRHEHQTMATASRLSLRERAPGMTAAFRVAPLTLSRMLVGQYAGYEIISFVVAVVLAALRSTGWVCRSLAHSISSRSSWIWCCWPRSGLD